MTLQPHQERVIQERDDLVEKLNKLYDFTHRNPLFNDLAREDADLLVEQAECMSRYADCLNKRIARF